MTKSGDAKSAIMQATITLIQESGGDPALITTRAIAERADIGIGLVNYHFQTKDRLIELCVQHIIGNVISHFRPQMNPQLSERAHLAGVVKQVADFLAENPAVSRISILGDFQNPQRLDNTMKTVLGFCASWKNGEIPQQEKTVLMFALTSVIQAVFVRKELSGELFGYDFNVKKERDAFIDLMIGTMIKERNGHES